MSKNNKDMHYRVLADRVRYFKEEEERVANMSSVLEEMREEAAERAERENSLQIAEQLLLSGKMGDEEIAAITRLTMDEVRMLSKREAF